MEPVNVLSYESPVGEMLLGSCNGHLYLCDWAQSRLRDVTHRRICSCLNAQFVGGISDVIEDAISQLNEYFEGKRTDFSIPFEFVGTDFQRRVWLELTKIPYGETISYLELARRIGNPKGVRAVALAVGANTISIIVPCHRVIGTNHKLTGYGGGLTAKQGLLTLEARVSGRILPLTEPINKQRYE